MMVAVLFSVCVSIVIAGWLWFYIARPILEDYGFFVECEEAAENSDIMSRSAFLAPRTGAEPAEPGAVLTETNQANRPDPPENEPAREPLRLRQLPREELIVLLAVQRTPQGGYAYSANQITTLVGGTAAPVKALIAEVRAAPPAKPATRIGRPVDGWSA